jgi:hypothetical protein
VTQFDSVELPLIFLMPEEDGVSLDYRGFDGRPVRIHFRFTQSGKIRLTACEPIKVAA